ncbi:MAG: hypothetical protein HKP05_05985, partial [Woeseiaceae bacterium]|nr:hypothetical protein [Gammaproteobacteria bacterium]NNK25189.1 hypothetical protein [Woeseiaceae bacterium]
AADIIKHAMIDVHAWLLDREPGARMIMQVHDELVFEVHKKALETVTAEVTQRMNAAAKLKVPLKVDVGTGTHWDEAH